MKSKQAAGLAFLVFENLDIYQRLRHGISLRRQCSGKNEAKDKVIEFDLSLKDNQNFEKNQKWFCQAVALPDEKLRLAKQVHGAQIKVVHNADEPAAQADGLCTSQPEVGLMLLGADCPLILVYDPKVHAVGVAHAGWRGTIRRICENLIIVMCETFGCQLHDMIAGIGPAICVNCYKVGTEVIDAVNQYLADPDDIIVRKNGRNYFDLVKANKQQLINTGLKPELIETSGWCTSCHNEMFYSYRREGKQAGRWGLLAGLTD